MKIKKQPRDVWIAATILLLIVILAAANVLVSYAMLDDLLVEIDGVGADNTEKAEALEGKFSRVAFFLSVTINHDDLEDAEELMAELNVAVRGEDADEVEILKSRLKSAFRQLGRLSCAGIDSII